MLVWPIKRVICASLWPYDKAENKSETGYAKYFLLNYSCIKLQFTNSYAQNGKYYAC